MGLDRNCSLRWGSRLLSLATVTRQETVRQDHDSSLHVGRTRSGGRDHAVFQRIFYEFQVGGESQLFEDPRLVKPYCAVSNLQNVGDFFHGPSLCQHLKDFTLPAGKMLWT